MSKNLLNPEQITQIVDGLPNIVFSWQPEKELNYINSTVEVFLGYTPTELQKDPGLFLRLIHPTDRDKVKKIIADLISVPPKTSETFTVRVRHKKGALIWLSMRLSSITQTSTAAPILLGVAHEITDEQKSHNTLKLQATLLSYLNIPFFATNLQGQIIFWNEITANLFDQNIYDAWQQPLRDLLKIDPAEEEALLTTLLNYKQLTHEFSLETKKGEPFWIKLSGRMIENEVGLPIGFLFSPIEITNQKISDTLRKISAVLVSSLKLDQTLTIILESLEKLLKFDSTAIYLLTPNNRLKMVGGRGMPYIEVTMASATEIDRFPLDEAVLSNKKPLAITDVRQDERWTPLKGTEYIRSWLGVPLLFGNKPIGLVTIDRATIDPFTSDQIVLTEAFAGHAAIALQNAELFSQVQSQQKRLRKLSTRVVAAQEEERRRISRELHDEMGQALTALKLNLQMLLAALPTKEILVERLNELIVLSNDALQEVRRLAIDLRPAILDDLGLVPTLNWYQTQFQKRSKTKVTLSITPDLPRLSPEIETVLYRVVQEALTNVSRHAEADNVEISLSMDNEAIHFSVIDDGKGFLIESDQRVDAMGVGLIGMFERIEDLNGILKISSSPGEGTCIFISIPSHVALNSPSQQTYI